MKISIIACLFMAMTFVGVQVNAQEVLPDEPAVEVEKISLKQTPGAFETESLQLTAGTYVFEVTNAGVDHEVGFVIAPIGQEDDESAHLQDAYLQSTVNDGETATSNVVNLEPGEYVYFCPLNPTPKYTLIVE